MKRSDECLSSRKRGYRVKDVRNITVTISNELRDITRQIPNNLRDIKRATYVCTYLRPTSVTWRDECREMRGSHVYDVGKVGAKRSRFRLPGELVAKCIYHRVVNFALRKTETRFARTASRSSARYLNKKKKKEKK